MLTSIGGNVIVPAGISSSELPPEKEVEIYDRKVHKACREMVQNAERELKGLEVPFFCTRERLMEEQVLVELKRKMLVLLEDLCGEEREEEGA